jgi:Glucose / Sorbosone dehydrogenase
VAGGAQAGGGVATGTAGGGGGGLSGGAGAGAGTAGMSNAGGSAGSAGSAGSGGGPVCKVTPALNGSGLAVSATDISAFKYATAPATDVVKAAYDPAGHALVFLTKAGKLFTVDPNVALPTTASAAAVTTTKPYDSGYAANAGYVDHRGLAFGPDGSLYVLAVQVSATSGVNIKKGAPGVGGGARVWTTLVSTSQGFAAGGTDYDHSFSGIAVSPDGMSLFFSSGSRTEHGEPEKGEREVPLTSAIFKVSSTTPTDLKNDEAALKPLMFADGTRNAYDLAFNAAGDLFGTDNGPDIDLPDEVNFLEQGKHYGFPWRFGAVDNPVRDAAYVPAGDKRLHAGYGAVDKGTYAYDAAFPAAPAAVTFTDPVLNQGPDANFARADRNADAAPAGVTGLAGVTGHRSPLGIAFDTAGALCGDYYKQGFLLSYGAVLQNALGDAGNDLLLLSMTKTNGVYTMKAKQLAKGMSGQIDSVLIGNKLFTVGYGGDSQVFVFVLPTP